MTKILIAFFSVLLLTFFLTTASAQDEDNVIAKGKAKSAVCSACHGVNGKAYIKTYPNLSGQNKPYLISALNAYKNKQRQGAATPLMTSIALGLSDADIKNLAAYYSSLKP